MSPKKKINVEQLEAALHEKTGGLVKEFNLNSCLQIVFFEGKAKIAVFVNGDPTQESMHDVMVDSLQAIIEGLETPFTTYSEDEGDEL